MASGSTDEALSPIWGFMERFLEELVPKLNLERLASLSKGTEA